MNEVVDPNELEKPIVIGNTKGNENGKWKMENVRERIV